MVWIKRFLFLPPFLVLMACGGGKLNLQGEFVFSSAELEDFKISLLHIGEGNPQEVIFVLDPSTMLPLVKEAIETEAPGQDFLLVGVGYPKGTKRMRDYTHTDFVEEAGGADAYFSFLESELIPELEKRGYVLERARTGIVGHSLGGLAVSFAFSRYNRLFANYISLSPALMWDEYSVLALEQSFREGNQDVDFKMFVGVGKEEDLGMGISAQAWYEAMLNYDKAEVGLAKVSGGHLGSRKPSLLEAVRFLY